MTSEAMDPALARPRAGSAASAAHVVQGLRATSQGDLVEILSPEGVLTQHADFPIEVTADLLKGLYRDMMLVRRIDREANALQRQGQLSIWVPLLGQEAAQIGAGRAMAPRTWPSRRTASMAWPGAAASTRRNCWASSGAPIRPAGTPRRSGSTPTPSSSATRCSTPSGMRWARSSTG